MQPLFETFDPILDENDHERQFDWEDRLTGNEWEALRTNLSFRHDKIEGFAKWRMTQGMCMSAAMRALQSRFVLRLPFLEAYKAELQQEAFPSDDIVRILHRGIRAMASGLPPWAFPLDEFMA